MNSIDFTVLEDKTDLIPEITREIWFITRAKGPSPIRRELYKINNESVIALRDSGIGVDTALYVEENFLNFFKDEPELDVIMHDQGITNYSKIKLFRMEE